MALLSEQGLFFMKILFFLFFSTSVYAQNLFTPYYVDCSKKLLTETYESFPDIDASPSKVFVVLNADKYPRHYKNVEITKRHQMTAANWRETWIK